MEKRHKPKLHIDWIEPSAIDIVKRLQDNGFETYLVGGCVRDLLAGIHPKDYDIVTDARPEEVRRIIRGSYIIGRRFQLVLVKRGQHQFEVATYRRNALPEELQNEDTKYFTQDNFFGTPEEDARRRDFTINALFYDPISHELVDFVDGLRDIENGLIKMIGDTSTRITEDPIRILRAIRIAHKLRFSLDPELRYKSKEQAHELEKSLLPRKREEYLKFFKLPDPSLAFLELYDLGILNHLIPGLSNLWSDPNILETSLIYLKRSKDIIKDPTQNTQVLLPLFLGLAESLNLDSIFEEQESDSDSETEAEAEGKSDEISLKPQNDENKPEKPINLPLAKIEKIFKDEMGVFKSEQTMLNLSYILQPRLELISSFKKRGQRRQFGFLLKEEFPLALRIAEADLRLGGKQIYFWQKQLDKAKKEKKN